MLRRKVFTLSNGLRVVTAAQRHLHRAALALVSRAGSLYESEEDNGLSHFVEHMLFRGTREHPGHYEFHKEVEDLGGSLQAVTYCDHTVYELFLPPANVVAGIALLGELVRGPLFAGLDLEREVIRAELLDDLDEDGNDRSPDTRVRRLLFPGHPYGWPVAGPPDRPDRFGLRDCKRFVARHFTGHNLVLAAAGPIDPEAVARAAHRALGGVPAGEPVALPKAPAPRRGIVFEHLPEPGASRVEVRIDLLAPGRASPLSAGLQVLLRTLDDGMATRLHRRVVDERGLAYEVFAEIDPVGDLGVLEVGGACAPEKGVAYVAELVKILRGLADRAPSETEVRRARRRYVWELEATTDDSRAIAAWFGEAELAGLGRDLSERVEQIRAVTRRDVRDVARSILSGAGAAVTGGDLRMLERRKVKRLLAGLTS